MQRELLTAEATAALFDEVEEHARAVFEAEASGLVIYLRDALRSVPESLRPHVERRVAELRAIATANADRDRAIANVGRVARERDEARDDATRFRHELKLAEGLLSKPGADVGGVITGLRLAQKRETGTWTIPAEKLRGGE